MKLYNTLYKSLSEIKPLNTTHIRIYTCGPTVYDHSHIGNLSSFIFADTLRRVLTTSNQAVTHVMNFTDVDDKTIKKAREYPRIDPKTALKTVTEKYSQIFLEDMQAIGNDVSAMTFTKATEHIEHMQQLVKDLYSAGFAYIAEDGVYFSIEKYKASGKMYGQLLEITTANTAGARIQNDEYDKDSAHDFALWKVHKDNEPLWEFRIDDQKLDGRPGWHIECSAMSQSALGLPFDIHTGGIDLIFPHHENEIAQSTALTKNSVMATVFAYNEHLLIDGRKMSKSLQNFYTLTDLSHKGFEPLAFRMLMLQSHYRSQTNFTWESLAGAQNRLQELRAWADLRHQASKDKMTDELDILFASTKNDMLTAMQNDLNSPMALVALNKLVSYMATIPIPGVEGKYTEGMLQFVDDLLGLQLNQRPDITDAQKELIRNREDARTRKDWSESDTIRTKLIAQGLAVRDTENGTIWSRVQQ
jgi:cysteinyl-tRNA synthetase